MSNIISIINLVLLPNCYMIAYYHEPIVHYTNFQFVKRQKHYMCP